MNRSGANVLVLMFVCSALVLPAAETKQALSLSPVPNFRGATSGPSFRVVATDSWPQGLVPVFVVETEKTFELRRLPARGQENFTEPLFFALAPEDEPHAVEIAGRWSCTATNMQRSRHSPDLELAVDGERVAGRFGQQGEYRVASISGGTFRSNRLELEVEWVQDRYTLMGEWQNGKLSGSWRQQDDSDHGTWEAIRSEPPPKIPVTTNLVPLYEWRRGHERCYSTAKMNEPGWQRMGRPLCRVWTNK